MAGAPRRELTLQQRAAIHTRRVSVALSAGAGCGKTFVLTERFLSHLDPAIELSSSPAGGPARLDELVAITFTRRAAREMRERIRSACQDRLFASETSAEVAHWLTLVRGLERARISTIDSFCATFLRAHAVEAGIDPGFSVLDGAQSAALMTEAIDNRVRELLAVEDESLVSLAVDFGLHSIRDMLREALTRSREPLELAVWLERTPEEVVSIWETYREETALPRLANRIKEDPDVQRLMHLLTLHPIDNATMTARQAALLGAWNDLNAENLAAGLEQFQEHARVQGAGVKTSLAELGIYDDVKSGCEALRDLARKASEKLAWDRDVAIRAAAAGLRLARIVGEVQADYRRLKFAASALDFRDLVAETRALLRAPQHRALRDRIASETRLLLVDEFQDTDPLQVELVEALCGDGVAAGRLFFVGDVKQSIYRFRGADPAVFGALRSKLPVDGQLPLSENFRSQPAILHFVNALFAGNMGEGYEPLVPRRPQVSPEPAIEFLWAGAAAGEPDNPRALREQEADWIARRIRQLIDSQEPIVWDGEGAVAGKPAARPARPGDFAILFRALSDVQFYEAALRRYDLDYYLVGGHAFYSQQEVFDLLNLLRTLSSPTDMASLAGVLRSPFFALQDETLFWLAQHPGGLSAGIAAVAKVDNISADERDRALFAQRTLDELRACKDRLPVAALMERSLALTGYDALLLTEFLGQRKLANLRKLIEQARSFDSAGVSTLAEFVTQLDEFVSRQPDEAMAATQPEASDVIRLMTIHQSKGLEFPIVVVPDLQRASRSNSGVAYTRDLGLLLRLPGELESREGLTGRDLYGIVEADADRAEATRLLYVATTRAADYLILSSGIKDPTKPSSPWMRLLARRFSLGEGTLRDESSSPGPVPRVRVTPERPDLGPFQPAERRGRDLKGALAAAEKLATKKSSVVPKSVEPIPVDPADQTQFSFSELDGALRMAPPETDWVGEIPTDGEPRTPDESRLLGTLTHALLAELPAAPEMDIAARARHLAELIGDAADGSRPRSDRAIDDAVRFAKAFQASDRFAALRAAAKVHAEIEFLLAWPPDSPDESGVYFRGFIDCLYRDESGRWHVLDYKTNRITSRQVASTAAKYEPQMLLYALAVEQALGEPPASLTLSFLEPGIETTFPYSPELREAVIHRLNNALAAFRLGETATT